MDSTRLLAEKLTLARELSSLRPEVDQLRSQAALHQALLAEKLSLQRQLNTIQVELETEKRSTKRVLANQKKSQAEDVAFESLIEKLQEELAKERRDRQKHERQTQNSQIASETKISTLESRLDSFRTKLKNTKEQLQQTQVVLENAQGSTSISSIPKKRSNDLSSSFIKQSRKRAATRLDGDALIGTPGELPAAKRSKSSSLAVGEKSTFSITPFLNRTASVAPESPNSRSASSDAEENIRPKSFVSGLDETSQAQKLDAVGRVSLISKPGISGKAEATRTSTKARPGRKLKSVSALDQVVEERDVNNDSAIDFNHMGRGTIMDSVTEEIGVKKKKRKLLTGGMGETLFDEDEADAVDSDRKLLQGARSLGALARGGTTRSNLMPKRTLNSAIGAFGAISPLKKDRKNVV